ncbi:MAG: FAD-dependent oxidoreductase [Pseudonocardia sp.]|nr:FAD-dependent oxidoreductase [Pseudonocardia sp.]
MSCPDDQYRWSPTDTRPRTPARLLAGLGVLAVPVLVVGLWFGGTAAGWLTLGIAAAVLGTVVATLPADSRPSRPSGAAPISGTGTGDLVPGARVLVVGGGYVGLVAARALQARLGTAGDGRHRRSGPGRSRASGPIGSVTVVDPQPHMTYQPFLPEAAGGSIAPRHLTVALRRVLDRCDVVTGSVVAVDDARRRAVVSLPDRDTREIPYDVLVIAPGAIARELPVPGLAERARTFRSVGDAAGLRDHVLSRLDAAASIAPTSTAGAERRARLLTFVVVGGGFAGVEVLGELEDLARRAGRQIGVDPSDMRWVLVEAARRIMPEVTEPTAARVHDHLTRRGIEVRVGAGLESALDGRIRLADGATIPTDTVVVAAGTRPHPMLERTDLPLDRTGKIRCSAMLQVVGRSHAFAAGDGAAVPDLARGATLDDEDPEVFTAPTAQHAVRQARVLADNVVAFLDGRPLQPYRHSSAGVLAGLGRRRGVAEIRGRRLLGWPAYAMHRAYHLWAMPTAERKARIVLDWVGSALLGRDPVAPGAVVPAPRQGDDGIEASAGPAPRLSTATRLSETSVSAARSTPQVRDVRESTPPAAVPARTVPQPRTGDVGLGPPAHGRRPIRPR